MACRVDRLVHVGNLSNEEAETINKRSKTSRPAGDRGSALKDTYFSFRGDKFCFLPHARELMTPVLRVQCLQPPMLLALAVVCMQLT